jgi:hypothetical protein
MNKASQSVTGIAEISLRVHDLDLMRRFQERLHHGSEDGSGFWVDQAA